MLKPEDRQVFWTAAGPWSLERFAVTDDLAVPESARKRLVAARKFDGVVGVDVAEGHAPSA